MSEMVKKTLPVKFRKNGCYYEQVKRNGKVAMYELRYLENGKPVGWEVFIVRVQPETELFGKKIEEHERCPSNEEFGTWGWSHSSLEDAEKQFGELVKREDNKTTSDDRPRSEDNL